MNDLNQYKQSGNLYLWEYANNTKNYPGFHMAFDNIGASSFSSFLNYLVNSNPGDFRTLNLTEPNDQILSIPNNRNSDFLTKQKVKIILIQEQDWSIKSNDNLFLINLNSLIIEKTIRNSSKYKITK